MNNIFNMVNQIKSNPMQFLMQNKLNIPQDIANNPNAIIQHLMNNGNVTQEQYNQAVKMAEQLGMKK